MTKTIHHTAVEAVIYLKNGSRRYGMLIDQSTPAENYRFISNTQRDLFLETNNPGYIELLPGTSIEAIDIDLK